MPSALRLAAASAAVAAAAAAPSFYDAEPRAASFEDEEDGGFSSRPGLDVGDFESTLRAVFGPGELARLAASGAGPKIARQWKAAARVSNHLKTMGVGHGTFLYEEGRRWRLNTCTVSQIFHKAGDVKCVDQLVSNPAVTDVSWPLNYTQGEGEAGVCSIMPWSWYDLFAVLAAAEKVGAGSVAGEPCEIWRTEVSRNGLVVAASACIAHDGVPREFNTTKGHVFKLSKTAFFTFSNVSVGPVAGELFAPTRACQERWPRALCDGGAETEELTLYRVHGDEEPEAVDNRNLGDALGDTAFFCEVDESTKSRIVTEWKVRVNTSWAQYAYCLYQDGQNICMGHNGTHVGRESALGFAGNSSAQGQCGPNMDTGSWYSLPASGQCSGDAEIGENGCTWKAVPARSVTARCIIEDLGLVAACAQELGHAPLLKSAAIFRKAFETSDPEKGGCPDAGLPKAAAFVV